MKNSVYKALSVGLQWGLVEATLGYLLHLLPIHIGSFFWFPLAILFLNKSYLKAKSYHHVMLTAIAASLTKLINLFFTVRPETVINPAASIILEAAAFIFVLNCCEFFKKPYKLEFHKILFINSIWRTLFSLFCFVLPKKIFLLTPVSNFASFIDFFILKNLSTTIIAFICVIVFEKIKIQYNKKSIQL